MAISFDKLTVKAQEALQESQREAENRGHQEIGVEHLLVALLAQEGGVVVPIIEKVGADISALNLALEETLGKLPKIHGITQVHIGGNLNALFNAAHTGAEELKDEYISTEHLFLAMLDPKSAVVDVLARSGQRYLHPLFR